MNCKSSSICSWSRLPGEIPVFLTGFWLALLPGNLLALPSWLGGRGLELAKHGKSDYVIIIAEEAIPAEKFAAQELSSHLEQVCGATFAIHSEKEATGKSKAIYVGQTEFARRQGIDFAKLGVRNGICVAAVRIIACRRAQRGASMQCIASRERAGLHWV